MSELYFPTAYLQKSITYLCHRIWVKFLFLSGCVDALKVHRFP